MGRIIRDFGPIQEDKVLSPIFGQSGEGEFAGYFHLDLPDLEEIEEMKLESIYNDLLAHVDEGNEDLRVDLGVTLDLLGKPDQAIRTLEVAENKEDKDALYVLGRILLEQKQAASEVPTFEEEFPIPESADWIMKQKEEKNLSWTAVVNYLREAIKYDSNNAPAQYYLGKAIEGLIKEESLKSVMDAYTAYLDAGAPIGKREAVQSFIYSQNPEQRRKGLVKKGLEAFKNADYPTSRSSFEEAILLGDKESFYHLGVVFEKTGDFLLAVNAYQQAIEAEVTSLPDLPLRFATVVDRLFRTVDLMRLPKTLAFSGKKDPTYKNLYLDQLIAKLNPHEAPIRALTCSPNGQHIFAVSADGVGKLWDVEMGTSLFTVDNCSRKPSCIAFSPDGLRLVVGAREREDTIVIWDVLAGQAILTLMGPHDEDIFLLKAIDCSPTNPQIVTALSNGVITVWDMNTGEALNTFELSDDDDYKNSDSVNTLKYLPGGRQIVSAGYGYLRIWDVETGEELLTSDRQFESAESMDCTPDGKYIAFADPRAPRIIIWNLEEDKLVHEWGSKMGEAVMTMQFSPDGNRLLTGSLNEIVQEWEVSTAELLQTINVEEGPINVVKYASNGEQILVGSMKSHSPKVFDLESGKFLHSLPFYQAAGKVFSTR